MSQPPSNTEVDAAPPSPKHAAASNAEDASHKVKRKPSGPGDVDVSDAEPPAQQKGEKVHASPDDKGEHQQAPEATQQPPSAGAPDTPVESAPSPNPSFEKPTEASSTKAIKTARPSGFTDKPLSVPRSKVKASRPKKLSFWSRLFHALVPCVGPSSAHPTRPDTDTTSATPLHEKQRDDEKKEKAQEASTSTSHTQTHVAEHSTTTTILPPAGLTLPSQPIPPVTASTPAPIDDPAVIVPPTPKSHRLPKEVTAGVTPGAVQPLGSTGVDDLELEREHESERSDSSSFTDEEEHERGVLSPNVGAGAGAGLHEDDLEDEEDRLIMNGGVGIPIGPDGIPRPLLPPIVAPHVGRKCLVLDLDETLVHSSFKLIPQADYVVPVEIEWQWHNVYVIKRPGVDNFLKQMGELYEIVVFTASLSKYADPVLDKLDVHKVVSHRLFRESCYNHKGNYVKDLSQLGRPSSDMIILDNSPASYIFHPNNAVPVSSWFNDPHDTELTDLVPFLADLRTTEDVRGVLDGGL